MNPIRSPPANLIGKSASIPVIKTVIVNVIAKSIASVMKSANRIIEYFLLMFTVLTSACLFSSAR